MLTYLFYPLSKPVSPGIKDCKNTTFYAISGTSPEFIWAEGMEQRAEGKEHGIKQEIAVSAS
jgi:hypothetical protein